MAKRKTPKAKDLRPEKISEQQLSKLQNLVKAVNEGNQQLGNIEVQKHNLLHDIMQVQDMIAQVQREFKEQYGNVEVSISDGVIKYNEDEQANS
jgi:hypothetical protein